MRIRPAAPRDLEAIASFQQTMAEETEGRRLDEQTLARGVGDALLDPDKARYLIAEDDTGRYPIGSLMLTLEWSDWRAGWFWWVQSVFVAPDRRGQGVYRALWNEVLRRASEAPDVIGVRLYVDAENESAQAVYERLGMHRTDYQVYEVEF